MNRSILLRARRIAYWKLPTFGVVLLLAVLLSLAIRGCQNASNEAAYWKGQRDSALAHNVALNAHTDSLQTVIAKQVRADSLKADSIASLQTRLRARRNTIVRTVYPALPDTCKPVVGELLAQTDSLDGALTDARSIIARQMAAISLLNRAADDLQAQNDTLVRLLKTAPVHKKPSRWSLGVGVGECLGAAVGPCFMVGATYRLFP